MSEISSLFALEAEELFSKNEFLKAVELSKKGIDNFPDYALGYRILIKSLIAMSDYENAMQATDEAIAVFPNDRFFYNFKDRINSLIQSHQENENETLNNQDEINDEDSIDSKGLEKEENEYIQNEMIDDNLPNKKSSNAKSVNNDIFDLTIEKINYEYTSPENLNSNNFYLIPGFSVNTLEATNFDAKLKITKHSQLQKSKISDKVILSDKFSQIANNLKSISFDEKEDENKPVSTKKSALSNNTISDTLASIYYKQGALKQALDAYKKLFKSNPEEKYERLISEIETKINAQK
jgi:tetratricopeptide (TPR) repeat protein